MKKILILLTLIGCASTPNTPGISVQQLYTVQQYAHETGCKDGFLVVWEMGAYKRPSKFKTAKEAWEEFKKGCHLKNMLYRADMEGI